MRCSQRFLRSSSEDPMASHCEPCILRPGRRLPVKCSHLLARRSFSADTDPHGLDESGHSRTCSYTRVYVLDDRCSAEEEVVAMRRILRLLCYFWADRICLNAMLSCPVDWNLSSRPCTLLCCIFCFRCWYRFWPSEVRGENTIVKWISWNRKRHQTASPGTFLLSGSNRYSIIVPRSPPYLHLKESALFLPCTKLRHWPMSPKLKPRLKTLIQSPPSEPPRNSFTSTDYYRQTREEYYSPISYIESSSPGNPYADLPQVSPTSSKRLVGPRNAQLHFT
ncbi:hypothetical protein B0H12DRAFT_357277 [Mycena haematopus]|nr:hypothetical protein B0H12DRAFT_357277 [Mycena haematopus]